MLVAVVAASCGSGDDDTSAPTTATTDTTAETDSSSTTVTDEAPGTTEPEPDQPEPDGGVALTPDMCEAFEDDEPPPNLADLVPNEYATAAQLLIDLGATFDSDAPMSSELIERFTSPTISQEFASFAEAVERSCGAGEASEAIAVYAAMTGIAASPADPDYCAPLETALSLDADDEESALALEVAISAAPDGHADALGILQALVAAGDGVVPEGVGQDETFAAFAGLGLYAEARCGVADAFATMMFAAAFMSLAGADGPGTQPAGLGTAPMSADPSAATAAVPADSGLAFEVVEIDLDDDGDYLVSAVVPVGWERDDSLFGATFDPPASAGFGTFTELTIDTGCDGMCEVTDWEIRLNADDGFIALFRDDDDLIVDRPTVGTPGIVMTKPGFSDGVDGIVIRWDNATDKYFVCKFELDDDDIALADALLAACEAAVPGWISAT